MSIRTKDLRELRFADAELTININSKTISFIAPQDSENEAMKVMIKFTDVQWNKLRSRLGC